ncbi:MAG TPA: hypothetical protein PLS67_03675 [Accumulibacter sp.]|jgi:hypothetical protein|nr:hypothetical protein [Accumulibacter sp.]HQC79608.1 hypothetical protein [Accumulibacter sp.]
MQTNKTLITGHRPNTFPFLLYFKSTAGRKHRHAPCGRIAFSANRDRRPSQTDPFFANAALISEAIFKTHTGFIILGNGNPRNIASLIPDVVRLSKPNHDAPHEDRINPFDRDGRSCKNSSRM